jgi:hypothetical protein
MGSTVPLIALAQRSSLSSALAIAAIVYLRHVLDTAMSSENAIQLHLGDKARTQLAVHG